MKIKLSVLSNFLYTAENKTRNSTARDFF